MNTKSINHNDRLIFALDVPDANKALALVEELGSAVNFYKIGLELLMSGDYFLVLKKLKEKNKKIFADLKFLDIPQTVASAVKNLSQYQVDFCTVHADVLAIPAATKNKGAMKILAVTVLTSHNQENLSAMGVSGSVENNVILRTKFSQQNGADGVIASGLEAKILRENLGEDFLIVTPGIRDVKTTDDQKRTVVVEEAFANGANYIVVGRPISAATNPQMAAQNMQKRIFEWFESC